MSCRIFIPYRIHLVSPNVQYPSLEQFIMLGTQVDAKFPTQKEIDRLVERELLSNTSMSENSFFSVKSRIDEALEVLVALGFPRGQFNERSALTLLAFLDLKPSDSWQAAKAPLRGITPIMQFMAQEYGKQYKPNTRETVRRQTVHQFLDAGLVAANPDRSDRLVNSPKIVYQIEESALELLKTYTSPEWDKNLRTYLA